MSKYICLVFLALVLVACQPSSGPLTATVVMVYEQTRTAVPSQTFPPTPAPPQTFPPTPAPPQTFTPHPALTQTLPPTPPPTQTLTPSPAPTQTLTPGPTQTLTQVIMADFFFPSCAFLDVNGNGVWDESDMPIKGAQMLLSLDKGQTFPLGDSTRSDGCALVWAPGGGIEPPFTIRMYPPKDSGLIPIGRSEVVYQGGPVPRFLFREP